MRRRRSTFLATVVAALLSIPLIVPTAIAAPVVPQSCTDGAGVTVVSVGADKIQIHGTVGEGCPSEVRIHALSPEKWGADPDLSTAPVVATVTANPGGRISAVVPRTLDGRDLGYFGFAAATTTGKAIGTVMYAKDWTYDAKYNTPRPTAASLKGLGTNMTSDSEMLGASHTGVSISINELMRAGPGSDATASIPFEYEGDTYYFNKAGVEGLDRRVKPMSDNGMIVYLVLVLLYSDDENSIFPTLVHPDAPKGPPPGFSVYAFNTVTEKGTTTFRAAMEFLAERYSRPDAAHGRIMDYILGNEIDSAGIWQKMGEKTPGEFVDNFIPALRLAYSAVRKYSKNIRVYTSFDHFWTTTADPGAPKLFYSGKEILDRLNAEVRAHGDFPWQLAFHPYPADMLNPETWNDPVTDKFDTTKITFKNLQVLPRYLQQKQFLYKGEQRHIVLSEQGCQDRNDSLAEQKLEAACWAYAYYKTVAAGGIDGFIWVFQTDNRDAGGLRMGLWTWDDRERKDLPIAPGEKKYIYDVFRDIDTPRSAEVTKFALPLIGATSWSDVIPGFDPSQISYRPESQAAPTTVGVPASGTRSLFDFEDGTSGWQNADHANQVTAVDDGGTSGPGVLRVHFDDPQVIDGVGRDNKVWRGASVRLSDPVDAAATPILSADVRLPQSAVDLFDPDNRFAVQVRAYATDGSSRYGVATVDPRSGWSTLRVDLSGWAGRANINRLKVWAQGSNGQDWQGSFDVDNVTLSASTGAATVPNLDIRAQASKHDGGQLTLTVTHWGPGVFDDPFAVESCDGISLDVSSLDPEPLATGESTKITASITGFDPENPEFPVLCLRTGAATFKPVIEMPQPAATVLYDFESSVQGWEAGDNVASVSRGTSMQNGPFGPHGGAGMLDGLLSDGPAEQQRTVFVAPDEPLDLSAASQVTAWVDAYGGIPGAAGYSASITLQSGTETITGTKSDFTPDSWNLVAVDVANWPYRNKITKITVTYKIDANWPGWTGAHMQVDDVGYTVAPTTTSAPCRTAIPPAPRGEWEAAGGLALSGLYGGDSRANATYRMPFTVGVGGKQVRVRFANTFGSDDLVIDCASIGLRQDATASTTAVPQPLTMNGAPQIKVPAGEVAYSDPVDLDVLAGQQLMVSTYARKSLPFQTHPSAQKTVYATVENGGNQVATRSQRPFSTVGTSTYWVDGIDVAGGESSQTAGTIAVIGDSISDAPGTAVDADTRWTDVLAGRLRELDPDRRKTVINAAIGGNALSGFNHPLAGPNGLSRLGRDVLDRSGVTDVIVFEGTNDILLGSTADEVIYAMTKAAQQIHDAGKRAIISKIAPRVGGDFWTDAMEAERKKVNTWIENQQDFDAVLDFNKVLADPANPDRIKPAYTDDRTHPNAAGSKAMGESVDLAIFDAPIRPIVNRYTVIKDFESGVQGFVAGQNVETVEPVTSFANAPTFGVAGYRVLQATMTGPALSDRSVQVMDDGPWQVDNPGSVFAWVNGYGAAGADLAVDITVYAGDESITATLDDFVSDKWQRVSVDVSDWPHRDEITGISITYRGYPASSGLFQVDEVGVRAAK